MFWGEGDTGGYQLGIEKHSWEFPCFFASLYDPSTSSKYQKALKTQCMVHTIFSTTNLPDFMQIKCMNINFFVGTFDIHEFTYIVYYTLITG